MDQIQLLLQSIGLVANCGGLFARSGRIFLQAGRLLLIVVSLGSGFAKVGLCQIKTFCQPRRLLLQPF